VTIRDIVRAISIDSFMLHHEKITTIMYVIKNNNTGKHISNNKLLALLLLIDV
jgi:hypothetical protein